MNDAEQFDVVILGSGQGGKLLAWHLGQLGRRVAVVERRWVGGSCPAVACMPSKNELWGAKVAHVVQQAAHFGTIARDAKTDMRRVQQRKQEMVDREIALHLHLYKKSGAELVMGSGRFVGERTIAVALNDGGARTLTGVQVVINVGTHAAIPDIPGIAAARPLTHIEALDLADLPAHLIVLGGGYTGIELAQTYRRFGSHVTVVEPGPQIMAREDRDIAEEMQRILAGEGIEFLLGVRPSRVRGLSGDAVELDVETSEGPLTVTGSDLLVAVGRVPNTAEIGAGAAGIMLDSRGFIQVNSSLQTTAPNVWAIGECAGSPQFTHVSVDDFRIVRDNMAGANRTTSGRLIPQVMFTDPPLARVGLSEAEATREGAPVRVAKLPMRNVLRTEATDKADGFMKILISADADRILGFAMIGSEAGEVIAAVQTAILADLPYPRLRDAAFAHLTVAEGLGPLLAEIS